ncbi:hypothetical protein RB653_004067 [Dictyostelium firmibasis]|uniref:Ankyrin repeat-containing protein n=1 Tax=Dictyostelium firmibasis TaxID=79012 RepID=A0AAN7U097_9MYCE
MDANVIAAIKFSHLSIVKSTDVETLKQVRGDNGESYLHLACSGGNEAITRYLIKILGVDFDLSTIRDNELMTPLHWACLEGKHLPINVILEHAINYNSSSNINNSEMIKKIINSRDHRGETPLYLACLIGSINCLKILLNNPFIDINQQSKFGDTALHIAIINNHMNCVELLIQKGADYNLQNQNNQTAKQLWIKSPLSINNTYLFYSKNELIEIIEELNKKINNHSHNHNHINNSINNNNNICKNCNNNKDLISIQDSKKLVIESIELFKKQILDTFDHQKK